MKADEAGEKINTLEQQLQKQDIQLDTILNELKQRKIPFEITQSNTSKALTRLAN
jgi:hypothetical protein